MVAVRLQKLEETDAFIVFDLDGASRNIGVTRLAPKILVDGATMLARSVTYQLASFELRAGGVSAGINAKPDGREAALAAFVAEVAPLVSAGTFLTEAGKGISDDDFKSLRAVDPRATFAPDEVQALLGATVAAAADKTCGLAGKSVIVEGLDAKTVSVVTEVAARGARVVGVSTLNGSAFNANGFDPAEVAAAISSQGPGAVESLAADVGAPSAVFAADADVVFVGSKLGVIDHTVAESVVAKTVVPMGPVPVTAKGLEVLRRAGAVVLPDFLTTCGPVFALFPEGGSSMADIRSVALGHLEAALEDTLGHPDGPVLAACYRVEAFLSTWQDSLPFGRPLA